jgi:hypothetical protein
VNGASTTSVKVSLTVSNFISNGVGTINQRVATFMRTAGAGGMFTLLDECSVWRSVL